MGSFSCDPILCKEGSLDDDHSNDNLTVFGDLDDQCRAKLSRRKAGECGRDQENRTQGDRRKWGKFSEQDLSALKNRDDVVTQIVAKYGLEKQQAQNDVDSLMKGRQI
jgi:hypothetical protein